MDTQRVPEQSDQRSEVAAQERLVRRRRDAARRAMFDEVGALYEGGSTVTDIAWRLGLGRRRVYRWVRRIASWGSRPKRAKSDGKEISVFQLVSAGCLGIRS